MIVWRVFPVVIYGVILVCWLFESRSSKQALGVCGHDLSWSAAISRGVWFGEEKALRCARGHAEASLLCLPWGKVAGGLCFLGFVAYGTPFVHFIGGYLGVTVLFHHTPEDVFEFARATGIIMGEAGDGTGQEPAEQNHNRFLSRFVVARCTAYHLEGRVGVMA